MLWNSHEPHDQTALLLPIGRSQPPAAPRAPAAAPAASEVASPQKLPDVNQPATPKRQTPRPMPPPPMTSLMFFAAKIPRVNKNRCKQQESERLHIEEFLLR